MSHEVAQALATYGAGLDTMMDLLDQLERLSRAQREASRTHDLVALQRHGDERDRVTALVVALEADLAPWRRRLSAARDEAATLPGFPSIASRHAQVRALVARVLGTDESSLGALRDAEAARRFHAQAVETGEQTLAAYRRVVSPTRHTPALIDTDA
ncbi:MAG: hypothetical protein Q8L86_03825 [Vicinamibacterales bacterium]|nr:hypothetical protein [Vicinamibacterales bacterium]